MWLKKYAVFREVRYGVGWVRQELTMKMNRSMKKTLAHLSTEQINDRLGEGVENKTCSKQKIRTKVHIKTQKLKWCVVM